MLYKQIDRELKTRRVLVVGDMELEEHHMIMKAVQRLEDTLRGRNIQVITADSPEEAFPLVSTDMDIDAFLIACNTNSGSSAPVNLLRHLRARQGKIPVFLLAERAATIRHLTPAFLDLADELVWIFEDSPEFIAGRIECAMERSRARILPPLMKAISDYNEHHHEYSWAAPGHQGGVGFTKSPAGRKFLDFYGENLFRTDTGIERSSIGSLLDHEGAFGESEKLAAKIFGADLSFSGIVGTSGSNRTIMQGCLTQEDIALCDRNCHKSIEQGLILTGATPVYMLPTRNAYGIIGPVPPSQMNPDSVKEKIKVIDRKDHPAYAVVTNCTYDGLCYNAKAVEDLLKQSSDRIHFDEAWYGYARFHPLYHDHFAMRDDAEREATVFATHSTHKLLNALSQASYIHIRNGRKGAVDFDRFNQAYMMHTTTSPLYAICASNDIAGAMMQDCGNSLIAEVIGEAVDFRQACAGIYRESQKDGSWFFKVWNAETVTHQGETYDFADAPREILIREQDCWKLKKGDRWHGFKDLECDDWVMIDPVKVSILSPGMDADGVMAEHGVPASLVSAFLYQRGIVPTRTTDFQIMFLFSMGITKGKWGTLLNTLLDFRKFYEDGTTVGECLPELPEMYRDISLRDLGNDMFDFLKKYKPGEQLDRAFSQLPEMLLTPRAAYSQLVRGNVESVVSDHLAGRIAATSLIPYPPGIPMIMSGERFGKHDDPMIAYLHALEEWNRKFPGFEHVIEGAMWQDGKYSMLCVKE